MRRSTVVLVGLAVVVAALASAVAAAAEGEGPVTVPIPAIEMGIYFGFSPKALPQRGSAPVALTVSGEIGDRIYGDPPALRELTMEFDRGIAFHTAGIPSCGRNRLGATTETAGALTACRAALIGEGETEVEVHYPETKAVDLRSRLLVFKGGERDGRTTLLLHAYFSDPISAAFVVPVIVARHQDRRFGTRAVARIPQLGGGTGALVKFDLRIFPEVEARGGRINPISATCSDGELRAFDLGKFEDGEKAETEDIRACSRLR